MIGGEGASNAGDPGGMGAPAVVNDATWVHTFYNTGFWIAPGGDSSSTISATRGVSGNGAYTWSGSGLIADVQAWVSNLVSPPPHRPRLLSKFYRDCTGPRSETSSGYRARDLFGTRLR
jgi:hypothetical protein